MEKNLLIISYAVVPEIASDVLKQNTQVIPVKKKIISDLMD